MMLEMIGIYIIARYDGRRAFFSGGMMFQSVFCILARLILKICMKERKNELLKSEKPGPYN